MWGNEQKVVYIPVVHQTVHMDNDWLDYLTNLSYEFYDSQDQEINENFDTYKIACLQERDLATKQTRYIPYSGRINGLRLTKLPTVELPTLPYVKYFVNNVTETRSLGGFWVSFSSNYQLVDGALLELPPENIRVTINKQANNETEKPVMAILANPRTLVINRWIRLSQLNHPNWLFRRTHQRQWHQRFQQCQLLSQIIQQL
ncbi:hypothetical protein FC62_GL000678 [Amylolactobacillus amylotrophicus DSM 20534]|uniref:Uncharacterized protein n=3 Tax=Amylolactobacillus TaxID=2767876 RepID=A0A0R1YSG8_9LACO|nr:hypothetical protein LA20533_02110 [Amylolactobacillus amylophilus DSM 20533 = JCM 1125]KRK37912.1 hypothetical protein FC62_GL000678 [Amylolactobacillus amylotrophicus DSM 20534]KRM42172.1 hypothetical protein FD40_GL000957 [Amylolactobacillus amylophilus DSM 20533 = JCM 1125]